jgi:hypothetical protein
VDAIAVAADHDGTSTPRAQPRLRMHMG